MGHHGNALAQVVGPYTIGSVRYRVRAALTNKNQQGAYRGFGSEVNNWMLEQMVDKAARELGLDPVAIRRMNFIRDFPHFIPTGNVYDSGSYQAALERLLEAAGYAALRREQAAARAALANEQLRANLGRATATIRTKRAAVVAERADWEALRLAGRKLPIKTKVVTREADLFAS